MQNHGCPPYSVKTLLKSKFSMLIFTRGCFRWFCGLWNKRSSAFFFKSRLKICIKSALHRLYYLSLQPFTSKMKKTPPSSEETLLGNCFRRMFLILEVQKFLQWVFTFTTEAFGRTCHFKKKALSFIFGVARFRSKIMTFYHLLTFII